MIKLKQATIQDVPRLTEVSKITFDDDSRKFFNRAVGGPPGYDSEEEQIRRVNEMIYYKICDESLIIGGILLSKVSDVHMELSSIFILPQYQGKGLGQKLINQVESLYPGIRTWSLDTPSVCVRNHHLYEKIGYKKENEVIIDRKTNLKLFFYEKQL